MNDFNPLEMDEFAPKKPDVKPVEEGIDIREVQHVITQVVQFLMTKALHEKRRQDKFNPTQLGNVTFHVDYNDLTKETKLMFDKHPRAWDVNRIVFEMNNMEADIMMEKEAIEGMMDNPFTY